jgi:hypothetical protein
LYFQWWDCWRVYKKKLNYAKIEDTQTASEGQSHVHPHALVYAGKCVNPIIRETEVKQTSFKK